jgi:hypothetical protein
MSAFIRTGFKPSPTTGFTAISGSAPQTVTGNALAMMSPDGNGSLAVVPGTLSAKVVANITANTLTLTGKWQVSSDGSTWYNCATSPQNAAAVALLTGTGSLVTTTVCVPAPDVVYGWAKSRFVLTSAAAAGGGAGVDEASISYAFRVGTPMP